MWRKLDKRPFLNPFRVKVLLVAVYFAVVVGYFLVGLLPVRAEDGLAVAGRLVIPAIRVDGEVVETKIVSEEFIIPEKRIATYKRGNKILMMAHAATGFSTLKEIAVGDEIEYNGEKFVVLEREYRKVEDISMKEILESGEERTMILMTCAGEKEGEEYSERLIVRAESFSTVFSTAGEK